MEQKIDLIVAETITVNLAGKHESNGCYELSSVCASLAGDVSAEISLTTPGKQVEALLVKVPTQVKRIYRSACGNLNGYISAEPNADGVTRNRVRQ